MTTQNGKDSLFSKLPSQYKGVLLGVLLSTLALFLPWYSELDTFGNGVRYIALNGPTALIGLTLLILNGTTLFYLFFFAQHIKREEVNIKAPALEKWHGLLFLYFSFVLISIFFHSDFGQTAADKSLGFGFYLGTIGSLISSFFGIIQIHSERKNVHFEYLKKSLDSTGKGFKQSESEPMVNFNSFRSRLDRFSEESPVYKERLQKQKQIEEKIKNKLNTKP